jgi:dTDP-4-amino-4,6-dideoxygalactose transaminase
MTILAANPTDPYAKSPANPEIVLRETGLRETKWPALEDIFVTRPYLPPLSEFLPLLEKIWEARVLTNHGPYHSQFEQRLSEYLEATHISLVTNGTLALSLAIQALGLEGEVITTPYSFVATAHAAKLSGLTPVFVDVRPNDFNIDPEAIEDAITHRTSCILAVHCYGFPCNVDAIQAVAEKHGLKVIYDAAHAFGVRRRGISLPTYGDMSTLSFHATKVFNTFEGGAIVSSSGDGKRAVDRLRNFGIVDETTVTSTGTNAKLSEFNAALGLLQLKYFERVRQERARVDQLYRELLAPMAGIECPLVPSDTIYNYSYFPVLVEDSFPIRRDELYKRLKERNIHTRRYFYPLISEHPMYCGLPSARLGNLAVAGRVARQILCLPIYPGLTEQDQMRVVTTIADVCVSRT